MGKEIFRPIKGYEGYYEVSNLGKVKNLAKEWSVGRKGDTILRAGHRKIGYDFVVLCVDKVKKYASVHRLVAEHFCDNPNSFPDVNHKNGMKGDNRAENLEWCTQSYNVQHAYDNGLKVGSRGEENGSARFKSDDILDIRLMSRMGITQTVIASKYKTSQRTISKIVLRQRWQHI